MEDQKSSGRDAKGRFAPGNPGGPGRPSRLVEAAYLEQLWQTVTSERWAAICERAAEDAVAGDSKAREWVGRYLVGSDPVWSRHRGLHDAERRAGMTMDQQMLEILGG